MTRVFQNCNVNNSTQTLSELILQQFMYVRIVFILNRFRGPGDLRLRFAGALPFQIVRLQNKVPLSIGQEKPINANILGGTLFLGQTRTFPGTTGPVHGTNRDPFLGQTSRFLFKSRVKSPFFPLVPRTGGVRPLHTCPAGTVREILMCFVFIFCPPFASHCNLSSKSSSLTLKQKKRAQRLTFWVWRPPGGVRVFRAKGWWPKSSCPPSKVCLPWASKRGLWDVPGILPGCPRPLGLFKKFVQKKFVRILRSLSPSGRTRFL